MFAIRVGIGLLSLLIAAAAPATATERVALVIGNSAYVHAPYLPNPVRDATAFARALEDVGFTVILGTDLEKLETHEIIRKFSRKLMGADAALFYYAGHGLQVDGRNHLIPVDAKLAEEADLDFEAVNLDLGLRQLQRANTGLVFLDACRDNPLAQKLARSMAGRSGAVGRGLAPIESGLGMLIAFSTQPGNIALDGADEHSPFTGALLEHVRVPGLEVRQLLTRVRKTVIERTDGDQRPWDHSSLTGDFFFVPAAETPTAASPFGIPSSDADHLFWSSIKDSDDPREYEAYLAAFPKGVYAALARIRAEDLQSAPAEDGVEFGAASPQTGPPLPGPPSAETTAMGAHLPSAPRQSSKGGVGLAGSNPATASSRPQRLPPIDLRIQQDSEADGSKDIDRRLKSWLCKGLRLESCM
jgi:hypothetical protein